jgi:hypothetical protein
MWHDGRRVAHVYTVMMIVRPFMFASVLLLAWPALAAPAHELPADALRVGHAQQQLQRFDREAARMAQLWWEALDRRGAESLLQTIERPRDRSGWAGFEQALETLLMRMRDMPPREDWLPLLEHLASFESLVHVRHPETTGDWWLPAYPVAERAVGTLQLWQAWLLRQRAVTELVASPSDFLRSFDAASGEDRRVMAAGLADTPAPARAALKAMLLGEPHRERAELWLRLVETEPSRPTLERALALASAADAVDLLDRAHALLDAGDAVAVLTSLAEHPELGSLAMQRIGDLVPTQPHLRDWLLNRLGEPDIGTSAAAALVRRPTADLVEQLGARLDKADTPQLQRDLVLALRLSGSAAAKARVDAFLRSDSVHPELRASLGAPR